MGRCWKMYCLNLGCTNKYLGLNQDDDVMTYAVGSFAAQFKYPTVWASDQLN